MVVYLVLVTLTWLKLNYFFVLTTDVFLPSFSFDFPCVSPCDSWPVLDVYTGSNLIKKKANDCNNLDEVLAGGIVLIIEVIFC